MSTIYKIGLFGIAVISDFQGHGVGSNLMKRCMNEEKKMRLKYIYLSVFDDNLKAISMYDKYEFVEINNPNFFIKRLFTIYGWRNLGWLLAISYHLRIRNINKFDSSNSKYIYMSKVYER